MGNTRWSYKQENLNALKQVRELGIQIKHLRDEIVDLEGRITKMDKDINAIKIPKLADDLEQLADALGTRDGMLELRSSVHESVARMHDQYLALKKRFSDLAPSGVWIKCEDSGVGYFGGSQRYPLIEIEPWEKLQKDPSLPDFADPDSLA